MIRRRRSARALLAILVSLAAAPAYAQFDVRPFVQFADQRYSATATFHDVFGSTTAPAWGGGVDLVVHKRFFVDLSISRLSKSGQRAFVNNGDVFRLGIPLRVTSIPIEASAGYRFRPIHTRLVPYAGAGVGSYSYTETSDFSTTGEDVNVRHAGVFVVGGAEFRVSRWMGIAGDAHYSRVPGILGQAGISRDVNESDFGGIAGRVRLIVGR